MRILRTFTFVWATAASMGVLSVVGLAVVVVINNAVVAIACAAIGSAAGVLLRRVSPRYPVQVVAPSEVERASGLRTAVRIALLPVFYLVLLVMMEVLVGGSPAPLVVPAVMVTVANTMGGRRLWLREREVGRPLWSRFSYRNLPRDQRALYIVTDESAPAPPGVSDFISPA